MGLKAVTPPTNFLPSVRFSLGVLCGMPRGLTRVAGSGRVTICGHIDFSIATPELQRVRREICAVHQGGVPGPDRAVRRVASATSTYGVRRALSPRAKSPRARECADRPSANPTDARARSSARTNRRDSLALLPVGGVDVRSRSGTVRGSRRFWTRVDERHPSTIIGAVPRVICPVHRGGRESHTWDPRKSATLFGFDVCWAPDRAPLCHCGSQSSSGREVDS